MKNTKVKIFLCIIFLAIAGLVFVYIKRHPATVAQQAPAQDSYAFNQTPAGQTSPTAPLPPIANAPSSFSLKIPFTSQAPTGNWDQVHNEDCEEAASVMANAYFSGNTDATLPAAQVENEMTTLNNWEDSNFGYHLDTTAEETAQMITAVYKLQATIIPNFTEDEVKKEIAKGNVVIIPVNGQQVNNPYYKTPGPIYHMLVVRGYNGDELITNDSGTRHGENYTYPFSTLANAAADWDHSTNTIDKNKKVMIVVSK